MTREMAASIGGVAATVPMTAVMMGLHSLLPAYEQQPLPPEQIGKNVADAAGLADTEEGKEGVAIAGHFGYGATAGAAYAAIAGKSGLHPMAEGALYGLAVWGGSYLGLAPATGLYKSATEEPAARNVMMIASHLVWGAALGLIFSKLADAE